MPIKIDFLSNTRDLLRGTKDVEKGLDDVNDSLKTMPKEGDKTERELTQNFRQISKASKDAGDDIEQSSRAGADSVDQVGDSAGSTGSAFSELGGAAKSALEGDVPGAAQGAISAVGELGGAIPGIGLALSAAATIGGLAFEAIRADAEATEKQVAGMYDDMIQSGNRYLSAQYLQKAIGEITGDQGKYNDALKISKDLGVDVNDVILASAGDQKALNALLDIQNTKRQAEVDAVNASNDSLDDKAVKLDAINAKYGTQNDKFNDLLRAEDSAGKRFDAYQSASSDYLNGLIDSASEATKQVNDLGDELYTLPDGTEIVVSAETGKATTDVTTFKQHLDEKTKPVEQTVKFRVDSSEYDRWTPMQKIGIIKAVPQSGSGVPWARQDLG